MKGDTMSSLEERVQALEQEHTELKQKIELHTLAIGGLVNKATLEAINEKNDKIFKALTDHDKFTNLQLAELREKVEVELEGKIVGMQTEMRQRFAEQDSKIASLDNKVSSLDNKVSSLDNKVSSLDNKVSSLDNKVSSLD